MASDSVSTTAADSPRRVLARLGRHLVSTYLAFDPRSLGLFRIVLGVVLLIDLYRRWLGIDFWYTDAGLVPTQVVRNAGFAHFFSLFVHASSRAQVVLGMALSALVYLSFTVGLGTRLAHLLSVIAVISLNNRAFIVENSGNYVLNLVMIWSLFLPLGRRFSVDALLAARRAGRRGVPRTRAWLERPFVSLAVLGLLLQLAVIYLFNVIQKTSPRWWNGTAVHYVLHDERMITGLGLWMREHLPTVLIESLSWGTLVVESTAVLCLLCPLWSHRLRLAAVLLLPALHVGFTLCLALGIFSFAMISFYPLLLAPRHWAWLERRSPIARALARLGASSERPEHPPLRPSVAERSWPRWALVGLREAAVLAFAAVCLNDLAFSNPAWPDRWRFDQPQLVSHLVWTARINQSWVMYSPGPSDTVLALAVEAVTTDGRLIDPYNEVASRYPTLPRSGIPPWLGQSQPFSDYTVRMYESRYEWCRAGFVNWILTHHERTRRPGDRIVSFSVYKVRARIPRPGTTAFGSTIFERVLSFP